MMKYHGAKTVIFFVFDEMYDRTRDWKAGRRMDGWMDQQTDLSTEMGVCLFVENYLVCRVSWWLFKDRPLCSLSTQLGNGHHPLRGHYPITTKLMERMGAADHVALLRLLFFLQPPAPLRGPCIGCIVGMSILTNFGKIERTYHLLFQGG